jgi:diguanylate cyclase (GGDEF)-like protein/PAS domain S-box-containing protein
MVLPASDREGDPRAGGGDEHTALVSQIADAMDIALSYLSADLRVLFVNRPSLALWNRPLADLIGKPVAETLPPEALAIALPQLRRALAGERARYERQVASVRGTRWVRVSLVPDIDAAGKVKGVFSLVIDIDEDRRLRESLAEREQQLQLFTLHIPEIIAYVNAERRYTFVNERFARFRGARREDIIGKLVTEVLGDENAALLAPYVERVRQGDECTYERLVLLAGGEERWVRVRMTPDKDAAGRYRGHYVVGSDVHELKMVQAALEREQARMELFTDAIPEAIAYVDEHWRYTYANRNFVASRAGSREAVLGKTPEELLGPELGSFLALQLPALKRGETFVYERTASFRGTPARWIRTKLVPNIDAQGVYRGYYTVATDIHELKLAEARIQEQEREMRRFTENIPVPIAFVDRELHYRFANGHFCRMLGMAAKDVIGRTHREILPAEVAEHIEPYVAKARAGEDVVYERLHPYPGGEQRWIEVSLVPERDHSGHYAGHYVVARDVHETRIAQQALREMATHDPLTGLANRALLHDRLMQAVARARRGGGRVAVLFIDLDHFKEVNDAHGHRTGDDLLREISRRIVGCLRDVDLLARLSGDEFVVLMEEVAHPDAAANIATRILERIRNVRQVSGHAVKISASLGISLYPDDADGPEALLKNADLAMYRAKEQGKNTYEAFSRELGERRRVRRALERSLTDALANDELRLHYQPIVHTGDGRIGGVEALIRWQRDTGELLLPQSFVPLAEETGLIREISLWTLDQVCADQSRWRHAGYDLTVSVNLAPRFFLGRDAVTAVLLAAERNQCEPSRLVLEVTETAVLAHVEAVSAVLSDLRREGVGIALDDFGTGYSSLSYLRQLPVDIVKIDRSFIQNVTESRRDAAIVRAVIALADGLGLKVVAEGVETVAQRDFLREEQCAAYQGFLFSPAVSAAALGALLREREEGG